MRLVPLRGRRFVIALFVWTSTSWTQELPFTGDKWSPPPIKSAAAAQPVISNRFEEFTPAAKLAVLDAAREHGIRSVEHVFSPHGYYVSVVGDTSRSNKLEIYTRLLLTNSVDASPASRSEPELNVPLPGFALLRTAVSLIRPRPSPKEPEMTFGFNLAEKTSHTNIAIRVNGREEWIGLRGETPPSVAEEFITQFLPFFPQPFDRQGRLLSVERRIGSTNRFVVTFTDGGAFTKSYHYNLVETGLRQLGIETRGPCTITRIGFQTTLDREPDKLP